MCLVIDAGQPCRQNAPTCQLNTILSPAIFSLSAHATVSSSSRYSIRHNYKMHTIGISNAVRARVVCRHNLRVCVQRSTRSALNCNASSSTTQTSTRYTCCPMPDVYVCAVRMRTRRTQASLNGYKVYCVVPTTPWAWRPADCARHVTHIYCLLMRVIQAIRARCECGHVGRMEGEIHAGQLIRHAHRTADRLRAATRSCVWRVH